MWPLLVPIAVRTSLMASCRPRALLQPSLFILSFFPPCDLSYPLLRAEGFLEEAERRRAVSGIKALGLSEVELWPCGRFAGSRRC